MPHFAFLDDDPSEVVHTHSRSRSSTTSWTTGIIPGSEAVLCIPVRESQSSSRPRRPSIRTAGLRDPTRASPISASQSSTQSSPSMTSSSTDQSTSSVPMPKVRSKRSFGHLRSLSLSIPFTKSSEPAPKQRTRKSSTPQSRYAHLTGSAAPLSLAQEAQLSQMLDGGSYEKNVRRVAESQAHDGAVSGVYRDGRGGLYRDEGERLELQELLPTTMDSSTPPPKKSSGFLPRFRAKREEENPDWDDESEPESARRDSDCFSDRRDSFLDPSRIVRHRDSTMISTGNIIPASSYGTHHRRSSCAAPGVLNAFAVPPMDASARAYGTTSHPRSHSRHRSVTVNVSPPVMHSADVPHHEKRRKAMAPPSHSAVPIAHEGQREFIASSFAPPSFPSLIITPFNEQQRDLKRKASRSKLTGLFKSRS